jgi:hypothetical protein
MEIARRYAPLGENGTIDYGGEAAQFPEAQPPFIPPDERT